MPRRKKNGQSPARIPGGASDGGNAGRRPPQGFDAAMASNFSSSLSSSDKEAIVKSVQEVFSHLDPEVIYIVLSECDFKVENAMDSFLELSVAAEDAAPTPSPVSGFERTAAALLGTRRFSEPRPDPDSSQQPELLSSPSSANVLSEDLDLLVDQELETLTTQQNNQEDEQSRQYLSSFPPPPFSQQVLPELLQSSLQPGSSGPSGGPVEHVSEASSPLDQPSTWEDSTDEQQQQTMVDFTHLTAERPEDRPKPPLDLSATGRPSAFQVYKKQESSHLIKVGVTPSEATAGGARSKLLSQDNLSVWNLEAEVFSPHVSNLGPTFITPVAQTPPSWPSHPRHVSPWLSQGPVSQAPLKPCATIPKSWAMPASQQQQSRLHLQGRVLVLLRGAPGSGKSTLARALVEHNPGGVRLSTDDYFSRNGNYHFDPAVLGEAHEWNHKRAKEAFERGANPIIIDNTNLQGWEMRPYVVQALKHEYKVLFREPDTWWKNKPRELERRTTHNVPVESIRRMLNGYERFVTVKSIMGSQMPEFKQQLLLDNKSRQPVSSEAPCPDLVGQPGLTEGSKETHPQLYSSLPDVSSIGWSGDVGMLEDGVHQSSESLNFQPNANIINNPEISDKDIDLDFGELDSELDTQLELNHPIGDQRIPDCIVESVMNEDHHRDELPVAFSESIGQRVRRQWSNRRSEPADLLKDTSQSDSEAKEEEAEEGEGDKRLPEMLDFVGDWPSERSLGQRQARRREGHKEGPGQEGYGVPQNAKKNKTKPQPDITELQKLLDLIQTGAAPTEATSSRSSSISSSFGQELGEEVEVSGMFEDAHGSRSDGEEREQKTNRVNSSRGELPDCVLDWRAAESLKVREPSLDRVLKTENDGNDNVLEVSRGTELAPLAALIADSLIISKPLEANIDDNGPEMLNYEATVGTDLVAGPNDVAMSNNTDNSNETRAKADDSHTSEGGQSPVCGVSVEADSSVLSGGSQERKQRQGRRSGKQFKLAFTSTQNCPASSLNTPECHSSAEQNGSLSSINTDADPNLSLSSNMSLDPNSDETKSEAHPQPPSLPLAEEGGSTQTEPQDFALLWRLNRKNSPSIAVAASECSQPSPIAILSGDSSRFVPGLPSALSAGHAPGHREVPYRVVHEKGTQVEEKELGAARGRLECLRILSCHFKLVSFDTLEDLYDKCHQDLEWTINLLLDSGERFFRDEDGENEEWDGGARGEDDQTTSSLCGALTKSVETKSRPDVLDEPHLRDSTRQSTFGAAGESDRSSENADGHPDTSHVEKCPPTEPRLLQTVNEGQRSGDPEHDVLSAADLRGGACGGSFDDAVIIEETRTEIEEEIASMDKVNRLLQAELDKREREERQKEVERAHGMNKADGRSSHVDIQSVELKLPTEVALQLTELFGPVGIDPGTCSADDFTVQMDLNLTKLLHQKWKETIQEKQRQAALAFHLLQEGSGHWDEAQVVEQGPWDQTQPGGGYVSLDNQAEARSQMPFMDHWNVSHPHISLRDIMKDEQALQENVEKTRQSRADLDRRDGATLLKENQLFSLFPTIDRHFLQDIFRDHNYSLTQTELFLRSLLDEQPVKTVVAPEAPRSDHHRAPSKEREQRKKAFESTVPNYQDAEDPRYEDFRAEASLQRHRQQECFAKAAEAFKQGRKDVASFYAQQGHMHGRHMREANHRAAVQIFERVNASLLPNNILDLHGLHVDEALKHLGQVLEQKTTDCKQGLCRPHLCVITGRGNHSQGGMARLRPAVRDYLTNKHYRFTEPQQGHMLVTLK